MKSCILSLSDDEILHRVYDDLQAVKSIVRIFKQSGWNGLLPNGFHLIQEVDTRFATTFSVIQRFLRSIGKVRDIIFKNDSNPAKQAFASLLIQESNNGTGASFPALEAIVDCFEPIVEAQTRVQASEKPTLHLALPFFQRCKDLLERMAEGGRTWRGDETGFVPPSQYCRKLCRAMVEWLDAKVRIHPLWLVGCYLHPYFREFRFIPSVGKRLDFKAEAEELIRSLMNSYITISTAEGANINTQVTENGELTSLQNTNMSAVSPSGGSEMVIGRKRCFSMVDYADSHVEVSQESDEVARYNGMDISLLGLNKDKFIQDDFAAVKFWHARKSTYPLLYKVALRVFPIPVSSCASERVFSAVNKIVTRDRASLDPATLEDIVIVRSLVSLS